ncbi:MAG: lipocalin family protein [Opitutales bacterium]|nr:lipocalin family protein [Opitutales bacterium]
MKKLTYGICGVLVLFGLAACVGPLQQDETPPPQSVSYVDIDAFMGRWYVIATTPGVRHRNSQNALKDMQQLDDGSIKIESYMLSGDEEPEWKMYEGSARIRNIRTNAEWEISYTWPIRQNFRILYLSENYDLVLMGDDRRNNLRILAREQTIPNHRYSDMMIQAQNMGYDISRVRRVPQNQ